MKMEDMSPMDRIKSVKGEAMQGNYLVNAKERNSEKKYRHQTSQNRMRTTYAASTSKADARAGSSLNY